MTNHVSDYCYPMDCEYCTHEDPKEMYTGGGKSCMTFDVLYCHLLDKRVLKHGVCEVKQHKRDLVKGTLAELLWEKYIKYELDD